MKNLITLLCVAFIWCCNAKKKTFVTVEVRNDKFPLDVSWTIEDMHGKVVAADAMSKKHKNKVYKKQVPLACGDYVFAINDSVGDGIQQENG